MEEIPIIFLVFVLVWVAVIVCCRSFSSEDLYITERARRRQLILSQQQALRQCHLPVVPRCQQNTGHLNSNITPIRVTTISRGGGSIAMDFYEIQMPPPRPFSRPLTRNTAAGVTSQHVVVETPPPPFSTAYMVSSPVFQPNDPPPPTYEESIKNTAISEQKNTKDVEMHI